MTTSPDSNKSLLIRTPVGDDDRKEVYFVPTGTETETETSTNNCYHRHRHKNKFEYYHQKYPPPYAILSISLLQLIVHATLDDVDIVKLLRFDPNRQRELWRFVSYMFLHGNWHHLLLNIVIQCLFAWYLERVQGNVRICTVYVVGGVTGALGAACVLPDLLVGASAGVYALLISHVAHIILNFHCIKYKIYQTICIFVLVIADVAYNLGHHYTNVRPRISWAAHVVGALTGFLLGLMVYRCNEAVKSDRINHGLLARTLYVTGYLLFVVLVVVLVLVNSQVQKCTPKNMRNVRKPKCQRKSKTLLTRDLMKSATYLCRAISNLMFNLLQMDFVLIAPYLVVDPNSIY